jgi:HSP20 family protein
MSLLRKFTERPVAPVAPVDLVWEPGRMLRDFVKWDPFREMAAVTMPRDVVFAPDFEVRETPSEFVFKADLPGVLEKDLEITLTNNRLTIAGKREREIEHDEKSTFYAVERLYGAFSRVFTLPDGIDTTHVSAALKDGVLTVVVPKAPEVQPKKISLQVEAKKS